MTREFQEAISELADTPEEQLFDGRFSDAVFELVVRFGAESREDWLELATDSDDMRAFAGVLGVTTIDRRNHNFLDFSAVMEDPTLRKRFCDWPNYQMLLAESMMYESALGRPYLLDKARATCALHLSRFESHHGAQNLLVEICLRMLALRDGKDEELLAQAEEANRKSIDRSGQTYAKYFAHRGLLQAYRGRQEPALADVQRAIDIEASNRWDYSARLAHYEMTAARIETICLRRQLAQDVRDARRDIENSRGQILTVTGLLAAVVAIVIVNVGVAGRLPTHAEALSLTLSATGAVVVGFGLLISLVLPPRTATAWTFAIMVPIAGLLLLVMGLRYV